MNWVPWRRGGGLLYQRGRGRELVSCGLLQSEHVSRPMGWSKLTTHQSAAGTDPVLMSQRH